MNDGQIVFEVTADSRRAEADIKDITKTIEKESKKWDDSAKSATDNIGNGFDGMLKKVVGAISATKIGQMLLNIGKDAIDAASDLEEVQNVVDTTFGDGARKIDAWAKDAIKNFGLTETKAKQFASTLGAMMKSAGMSGDAVEKLSTDLSGLAADMASFYNLDFDTAFQKIRAGICGEKEPLKQLSITMSVANLNAFALQQGLSKTFEQMDQGEQIMLRYQYIMQATADAQGDFSRTSDGFANSLRLFQSQMDALKTSLGGFLLQVVTPVITGINDMISTLTAPTGRTVLDDFADIDLQTQEKISDINATADKARGLVQVLNECDTKIKDAKTAAGSLLDGLPDGSDGNLPKLKDAVDTLKSQLTGAGTEAGNIDGKFATTTKLDDYKALVGKLSEDFGKAKSSAETVDKVLTTDGANIINYKGEVEGLGPIFEQASGKAKAIDEAVPVFDQSRASEYRKGIVRVGAAAIVAGQEAGKIDDAIKTGAGSNLETVKGEFDSVKTAAQDAAKATAEVTGALAPQSGAAQEADEETRLWLETCNELVKVLPGLSSIINTQTGEIQGGTEAVEKYIDAWEEAQTVSVMQNAQSQKKRALDSKFAELPGLELDARIAENAARKKREELDAIYKKYGLEFNPDDYGMLSDEEIDARHISGTDQSKIQEMTADYDKLAGAAQTARAAQQEQEKAYNEAVEAWEKGNEVIKDQTENVNESRKSMGLWSVETEEAAGVALQAFQEAAKAVADYYEQTRKATKQAVDNEFSGFKMFKTAAKMAEEAANEAESLREELKETKKYTDEEIEFKVNAKNAQITLEGMQKSLESQLDFIKEYQENLQIAREAGISDDILAQLADGSVESAMYLHAIAEAAATGDVEGVKKLNDTWEEVNKGKEQFTDTLTQQKLKVDETYNGMVATAEEAAKNLNVSEEIAASTGANVDAIVNTISSKTQGLKTAVDGVIAELDRLSGWGLSINLGSFGTFGFSAGNAVDGEHETGLNYVPFDGYLASLHEGEGILTAEENRIWRQFKDGQRGVDYDQLGGVMRDNINPGGNVYLDGTTVGKVVSKMQGQSYKTLQRSGWQA